jgi:hypothetical protein
MYTSETTSDPKRARVFERKHPLLRHDCMFALAEDFPRGLHGKIPKRELRAVVGRLSMVGIVF